MLPRAGVIFLMLVISTTMSLRFTHTELRRCLLRSKGMTKSSLYMARSFKPTNDPFAVKVKSKKTSKYSMPGYSRGDLDALKVVFKLFSTTEGQIASMSFDSFTRSKYLRYWPGTTDCAEKLWNEATEELPDITFKQLAALLSKLDKLADKNELDSEKERLAWELEDLNHDMLETFFERNAVRNKISFSDFITWEPIREELWYNEKGLTEKGVVDIWEKIAGCVSKEASKEIFVKIYKAVCDVSYEI